MDYSVEAFWENVHDMNGGIFTTGNKYLSTDLLFFTAGEGDEPTSPSFAAENAAIEASSASLEMLIATRYKQGELRMGAV